MPTPSTTILIIPRNHFDPTWRRAFAVPITYHGVTVQSYARVEEEVFERWLALAPQGYSFSESQTAVWREYLRRNPERLARLRSEIAAGRLCVQLGGETVQDTNLPTSEGLIRNFLVAQPLYRELGVIDSSAQEVAWVEDAFGNSPNYPQILAGVGAKAVAKLSYRAIPGAVWTGIDGTSLACMDVLTHQAVWPVTKHPPCPSCRGMGCNACAGSGMVWISVLTRDEVEATLERAATAKGSVHVTLGGEETLPDACVFAAIAAVESRHPGVKFRFATWADLWQAHRTELLAAVAAHDGTPSPDLNPAMPGCQVSRIALKQRTRDLAHRLVEAESALASQSFIAGTVVTQPQAFNEAWRLVTFNQFHDAITGTLLDGGADELHAMLDHAEALLAPLRPAAPTPTYFASPTTFELATFELATTSAGSIRLGNLDITYDQRGITTVAHTGTTLCATRPLATSRAAMRIGELGVESDFGDAWGKRIAPLDQYGCAPLSDFHSGVEVASDALRWRGTYAGGDRKIKRLTWMMTVRASADGQALDFSVEVDWHAESRRLRAWFPVLGTNAAATYEVPFGHVERQFDNAKWDYTLWNAHQNEYPMQNWVRAACTGGGNVAVLTRGLPGVRWMPGSGTTPGTIDLSLLRAPESEFCQVETHFYEFWDNVGLLDSGRHVFAYQLRVNAAGLEPAHLTAAGLALNRPGFVAPPFTVTGAQISAWKPAEDGDGWILRFHDASGAGGHVQLEFDAPRTVTPCDLLERTNAQSITVKTWTTAIRPHGIATVRIR